MEFYSSRPAPDQLDGALQHLEDITEGISSNVYPMYYPIQIRDPEARPIRDELLSRYAEQHGRGWKQVNKEEGVGVPQWIRDMRSHHMQNLHNILHRPEVSTGMITGKLAPELAMETRKEIAEVFAELFGRGGEEVAFDTVLFPEHKKMPEFTYRKLMEETLIYLYQLFCAGSMRTLMLRPPKAEGQPSDFYLPLEEYRSAIGIVMTMQPEKFQERKGKLQSRDTASRLPAKHANYLDYIGGILGPDERPIRPTVVLFDQYILEELTKDIVDFRRVFDGPMFADTRRNFLVQQFVIHRDAYIVQMQRMLEETPLELQKARELLRREEVLYSCARQQEVRAWAAEYAVNAPEEFGRFWKNLLNDEIVCKLMEEETVRMSAARDAALKAVSDIQDESPEERQRIGDAFTRADDLWELQKKAFHAQRGLVKTRIINLSDKYKDYLYHRTMQIQDCKDVVFQLEQRQRTLGTMQASIDRLQDVSLEAWLWDGLQIETA